MATTTNYGWTTPDDTALVKDGAAAIRTLGSSIDSTLKTQIDAQIPDSLLTTKGDIIAATGASTPARLAVGTNGQALVADSTTATGLKYATVGGAVWTQVATGSMTGTSISITGLSAQKYYVIMSNWSHNSASNEYFSVRLNNDSGANYWKSTQTSTGSTFMQMINTISPSGSLNHMFMVDLADKASQQKPITLMGGTGSSVTSGIYNSTSTITSIQIATVDFTGTVTFDAGTYYVWAYN